MKCSQHIFVAHNEKSRIVGCMGGGLLGEKCKGVQMGRVGKRIPMRGRFRTKHSIASTLNLKNTQSRRGLEQLQFSAGTYYKCHDKVASCDAKTVVSVSRQRSAFQGWSFAGEEGLIL